MPEDRPGRIKKTRWLVCLFVWWVTALFFYSLIAVRETHVVDDVTTTGIATIKENTANAGLPLLDRDVQALTQLAQKMSQLEGVVNVSIIDHKNKIIAFTDPDQLPPTPSTEIGTKDGVGYWHHVLESGARVTCFSGDISFAGTKIGEVLLVMDAGGATDLITIFVSGALISLLGLLFVLLVVDFQGIRPLTAHVKARWRLWKGAQGVMPTTKELVCPLCGCHKPLDRSFVLQVNLNRYPVIKPVGNQVGTAQILLAEGIRLGEISRREDLGWLRRQMIHR